MLLIETTTAHVPVPGYNPFDDLLVGTTTIQDPECTNTTLRLLSIATPSGLDISISFSQISRTFAGLRSLFLCNVTSTPQQILSLAHLEVLCVYSPSGMMLESMEILDTPALWHVYLGDFTTPLTDVVDRFLGRYAHQIESLVLGGLDSKYWSPLDLPTGFWAQFTALCLLGLDGIHENHKEWSGWSVVPPPDHPCRYLVCRVYHSVENAIDFIRSRWTWHDGVGLAVGYWNETWCRVVKNIQDGPLRANMEWNEGILPEL
jgi:hypothetical protein